MGYPCCVGCRTPNHSNHRIRIVIVLPLHIRGFDFDDVLADTFGLKFQELLNVCRMFRTFGDGVVKQFQLLIQHHILEVLEHLARQLPGVVD